MNNKQGNAETGRSTPHNQQLHIRDELDGSMSMEAEYGMGGMGSEEYGMLEEPDAEDEVAVEEPEDAEPPGPPPKGPTLPIGGFGSVHPGGSQFAFGDGRVGYLSESTSAQVLQQLGHRADGKLLDAKAY